MNSPFTDRLRLGSAIAASAIISQLAALDLLMAATLTGVLAFSLALLRLPTHRRTLLRRLLTVNAFVAMVWATLPWALGPDGLAWSDTGVLLAQQISLRTNAIALCCIGLLAGLDAFAVARAAAGLGLPTPLARLLVLTVRYLGVLDDTRRRIDLAMRARGFRPSPSRRGFTVLAQQTALILVHAVLQAERVELALRARGFGRPASTQAAAAGHRPRWIAGATLAGLYARWRTR